MTSDSVSIIIPCRNEERFIGKCLDSVISQDYPKDNLEVLVVDGMSEDGTRGIIEHYADKYPFIRLLDNKRKVVPTALNKAIENAIGEIIIRMDAHNIYNDNYISQCVKYLHEYNADNVGGVWITLPGADTLIAGAISIALSHPFGIGNAHYRIGSNEPKYVDTVPFGCFKKEVFKRIGLFDEDLIRNQDDEFNLRLIKNGGKILLVPEIVSRYHARDSLSKLWKMFWQYGYFKPLVAQKIGAVLTWRQLMPAFFICGLIIPLLLSSAFKFFFFIFLLNLALYMSANLFFSFTAALKNGLKHMLYLPVIFPTLHFSYGTGYLKGIWDFMILKKHRKKQIEDISLNR